MSKFDRSKRNSALRQYCENFEDSSYNAVSSNFPSSVKNHDDCWEYLYKQKRNNNSMQ